jgi:hypothetical protein
MRSAIRDARSREAKKAAKGKIPALVTVTLDQIMAKLQHNDYRCAVSGLPFWQDDADQYGPTMPSIDRIDPSGDYSDGNTRVILYGVNALRGRGSEADMIRIATAIVDRAGAATTKLQDRSHIAVGLRAPNVERP